jgi:hypothetical protein
MVWQMSLLVWVSLISLTLLMGLAAQVVVSKPDMPENVLEVRVSQVCLRWWMWLWLWLWFWRPAERMRIAEVEHCSHLLVWTWLWLWLWRQVDLT